MANEEFLGTNVTTENERGCDTIHDYDKEIADYTSAIEIDANDVFNFLYRGGLYQKIKDYDKAIADYKKIIEIGNKNDDNTEKSFGFTELYHLYKERGENYLEKKDYTNAVSEFLCAIEAIEAIEAIDFGSNVETTNKAALLKIIQEIQEKR